MTGLLTNTAAGPDAARFDALMPPQMAAKAEDIGAAKGAMPLVPLLMLAVLAGAFIAMGSIFLTTVMTGAGELPWGVSRLIGGLSFCLGLILVIVAGAELFTGNNLLIMAFVSGKLSVRPLLRNWGVVYVGNFMGAVATAGVMLLTEQYMLAGGGVGTTALVIAEEKCRLDWMVAFTRGVYCNALVCLAVWLCLSCRTTTDRILAIIFPITAFVATGFEHSIANMYFIPAGLLIKSGAGDEFWRLSVVAPGSLEHLTWRHFALRNLVPVTLGNIVGGAGFVGLVYWVVYQRRP
ncbi:MAG: formate transporter FocA [Phycisphaerae bacterium]|nr:formate transporter FocA [Phycisphaerae bacterium]